MTYSLDRRKILGLGVPALAIAVLPAHAREDGVTNSEIRIGMSDAICATSYQGAKDVLLTVVRGGKVVQVDNSDA